MNRRSFFRTMLGAAAGAALAKAMPAAPAAAPVTAPIAEFNIYKSMMPRGLPYIVMSPGQLRAYERLGFSNPITPDVIEALKCKLTKSPIDRQTKFPV
jgi:hypothetical protein